MDNNQLFDENMYQFNVKNLMMIENDYDVKCIDNSVRR